MHSPWAGGVILVAFAVLALILANIPQTAGVYHHLLESHLTVGFDHFRLSKPLEAGINDGLMVLFFFYVSSVIISYISKRDKYLSYLSLFKHLLFY